MISRFAVWVGAGVTTAGVSLAMLAGAGSAVADTGATPNDPAGTQSASADTAATKPHRVDHKRACQKHAAGRQTSPGTHKGHRKSDKPSEDPGDVDPSADSAQTSKAPGTATQADSAEVSAPPSAHDAADDGPATKSGEQHWATTTLKNPVDVRPDVAAAETKHAARSAADTEDAAVPTPATSKMAVASVTRATTKTLSTDNAIPAIDNSLTYTPGPKLRDVGALFVLHILRAISDVTGVNLYEQLNSLMESNTPPSFLRLGLHARKTTYTTEDETDWQVWEFDPPNPTGKTVVALHGGGFVNKPNLLQWVDYTTMARQTGATVIVPLYPLATTEAGRATVVVPEMASFISHQIELSGGAQNLSVYGDSAGSTIAMAAARQLLLDGRAVPSRMVLLSLAADFSMQNPDIRTVDDPILNIDDVTSYASHWTDGIVDLQHSLLSPLFYGPEILDALPPTTIYVGGNEILFPDTLLLHARAVEEGAPISVVVGTGLVHDWPLSGLPIYSETSAVRPDVYRQLGLTGDANYSRRHRTAQ